MENARAIPGRIAPSPRAKTRSVWDLATVVGLVCGFGLFATAIVLGGSPWAFVNYPALLIVLGGTFSAITICSSFQDVTNAARAAATAVDVTIRDPADAATHVLQVAERARDKGALSLQAEFRELRDHPLLLKGMNLVVDGLPGSEIEAILNRDIEATRLRQGRSIAVLRRAAEYSPAMGLIGTLIGLVRMLGNLQEPAAIGPSMAVALLTTFYGAVLANLVFSPLAAKLERNAADEALIHHLYLLGAVSVARQENPRRLEMLLNSILPPAKRVEYFD